MPGRGERKAFLVPVTAQELLGKRRSVVGNMWFVANDDEAAAKSFSAQRFSGSKACNRGADDRNCSQV